MGEFSISHWLIIGIIVLLFVGPKKLPGLGRGLGEAIRGFKKGLNEDAGETVDPDRQLKAGTADPADPAKRTTESEKTKT